MTYTTVLYHPRGTVYAAELRDGIIVRAHRLRQHYGVDTTDPDSIRDHLDNTLENCEEIGHWLRCQVVLFQQ